MTYPTGTYIARPDGYWWNGSQRASEWFLTPSSGPGLLPHPDVGSLPVGQANYPVPTGAVFVSTTGNDTTGNGTLGAPFATLTKAVAVAPDGSTIVVRGGVYTDDGGETQTAIATVGILINTKTLTIQNYPGEAVWFDGSREVTTWTQDGATWNAPYDRLFDRSPTDVRGANDNTAASWVWVDTVNYPLAPWPDMAFYDGVQLKQVATLAEVGPGKFFVEGANTGSGKWFQATKVHIGDNPVGHEVRVSHKVNFIKIVYPGCVLRGFGVRRYSNSNPDGGMIRLQRENCLVENVWVEDVAHTAFSFAGTTSGSTAHHITAQKVTVKRSGALGLHCYMADYLTIDRAYIEEANYVHYNYAPQAGGFKATKCTNLTVKNSHFNKIWGTGFWCDMSVDTAICVNTTFTDSDSRAIYLETGQRGTVANCLFKNVNGEGICVNNTDNVEVWNCTFVKTSLPATDWYSTPIRWTQDDRNANNPTYSINRDQRRPQSYYDLRENQWVIDHITMKNCVIAYPPEYPDSSLFAIQDTNSNAGTALALSSYTLNINNNFYHWKYPLRFPWYYPTTGGTVRGTTYYTLAEVSAATGQEQASTLVADQPVLDANCALLDGSKHATAAPLPANIAALVNQPTGTKQIGVFV